MNPSHFPPKPTAACQPGAVLGFPGVPAASFLWTWDSEGLCDFASPAWSAFTGRDASQELKTGWLERIHPEDLPLLLASFAEANRERQPFHLLYRAQRADGAYRWRINQGLVRTTPAGEFAGHIGQCFDVSAGPGNAVDEDQLGLSARYMIVLLQQTRLIAAVVNPQGRIMFCNDSLRTLLECQEQADRLIDVRLFERFLAPASRNLAAMIYPDGALEAYFPDTFESELVTMQGNKRLVLWHAITLREYCDNHHRTILIGDDITAARHLEEKLKLTASVFENTNQAMLITSVDGMIVSVNHAFSELTGYSKAEILGQNPRILQSGRHSKAFYRQMWQTIHETGHWRGDIWDRHKSGRLYPKFLSISAIRNEAGNITNYAGIFYEISERKAIEEKLDFLAHYDSLTGLPNRCLLMDRLMLSMEHAKRERSKIGVLYLDLDHFKLINDTLGHFAGDNLLKAAAQRMSQATRAADTVARLGGDEFVVLVTGIRNISSITQIAEKLLSALSPPYELDGKLALAPPSIGISVYPDDADDMEILLKHADSAMYTVKQTQRCGFRFFHDL
jgi:diguanylate cyclase (GGDEF)-like protein/PAS domain S-box-containing protein